MHNPTSIEGTFDSRLTRKPYLLATAAISVRKLCLPKKVADTTWAADMSILCRVHTGTVRFLMEYASTT